MNRRKPNGLEILKSLLEDGYTLEELVAVLEEVGKYQEQVIRERMRLMQLKKEGTPLSIQQKVELALQDCGIPRLSGYNDLKEAIILTYQKPELFNKMIKRLFQEVANKHNSTPKRVDRNISTVIEKAWKTREGRSAIRRYFSPTLLPSEKKPSNGKFIAAFVQYFRLQDENE